MPWRPKTESDILAALLQAEAWLAEGKSLDAVAKQFDVRPETLQRWQSDYADRLELARARQGQRQLEIADEAYYTFVAWILIAVVAFAGIGVMLASITLLGAPPASIVVVALVNGVLMLLTIAGLMFGQFQGRVVGRNFVCRRHEHPTWFWINFAILGVVVPLASLAIFLFVVLRG